ncbi:hypothetical protein [Acetobacterium wieringae]|uniref:hypothetical protein n=1 Tax=Acetobacterium wieringae TaxID=52694 RepID=UPI0026EC79EE|nr:hypothetical protein [Acetobacterium wieringae]
MKIIIAKAQSEGWICLEQGLVCGNRIEFVNGEKRISITLNPASYQLTNMSPTKMKIVMEADTLYSQNDPIVTKIRNLSFEDQTKLTGVAREIFLLICDED